MFIECIGPFAPHSTRPCAVATLSEILPSWLKTPPMIEHEVEPYSVLEVQQLIEAAKRERNGVRWVVALVLGLR